MTRRFCENIANGSATWPSPEAMVSRVAAPGTTWRVNVAVLLTPSATAWTVTVPDAGPAISAGVRATPVFAGVVGSSAVMIVISVPSSATVTVSSRDALLPGRP